MLQFKISGSILVIVMIFLLVFSMLSFQALMSIAMQWQLGHQRIASEERHHRAEMKLVEIERELMMGIHHCLIGLLPADQIPQMKLSWWTLHGCREGKALLFFEEYLGEDSSNNQLVTEKYYRITLLDLGDKSVVPASMAKSAGDDYQRNALILQSTLVIAAKNNIICNSSDCRTLSGRLMLRVLTSL